MRMIATVMIVLVASVLSVHAEQTIQVSPAAAGWGVEFPGEGFVVTFRSHGLAGERSLFKMRASNEATGLSCSADIVLPEGEGGSVQARSDYIERNMERMEMSDIRTYERDIFTILEYLRLEFAGKKWNQKNVMICLAHRDNWIYINLSKNDFTEEDQPAFDRIIEGVRLVEREQSDLSSAEFIELAIDATQQGKCGEAEGYLERALAINKVKTQMKKEDYVDTLAPIAGCYRENGEYGKAMTTLQTAIKLDAENPRLHYRMARVHAGLGDEGKAVASLNTVYQSLQADMTKALTEHRAVLPLPDPMDDASFASMKKNAEFKKVAKKINKYNKEVLQLNEKLLKGSSKILKGSL